MVSEDRRWKEKTGVKRFYGAYSLTCPAALQIYWKKRSVYIIKHGRQFIVFEHQYGCLQHQYGCLMSCAYALYVTLMCCLLFDIYYNSLYSKPSNKRNEKS